MNNIKEKNFLIFGKENVHYDQIRYTSYDFKPEEINFVHARSLKAIDFSDNICVIGLSAWREKSPGKYGIKEKEGHTIKYFLLNEKGIDDINFTETIEKLKFVAKKKFQINDKYEYEMTDKDLFIEDIKNHEIKDSKKEKMKEVTTKIINNTLSIECDDRTLTTFENIKFHQELTIDGKKFVLVQTDRCFLFDCEKKSFSTLEIPKEMTLTSLCIYNKWLILGGKLKLGAFAIIHLETGKLVHFFHEDFEPCLCAKKVHVFNNVVAVFYEGPQDIVKTYDFNWSKEELAKENPSSSCVIM